MRKLIRRNRDVVAKSLLDDARDELALLGVELAKTTARLTEEFDFGSDEHDRADQLQTELDRWKAYASTLEYLVDTTCLLDQKLTATRRDLAAARMEAEEYRLTLGHVDLPEWEDRTMPVLDPLQAEWLQPAAVIGINESTVDVKKAGAAA